MNTYHLKTDNRNNFMCFIIENYEYIKPIDFDTDYNDFSDDIYILSIKSNLHKQILMKLINKYNITII